jgi:hypothetical protein
MMSLNEIRYIPATSSFFLKVGFALKSFHTPRMLLRIKSTGRCMYKHRKQVKVLYYYIEEES